MYRTVFYAVVFAYLVILFSCAPIESKISETSQNIAPPKILEFKVLESRQVEFVFSKKIHASSVSFEISPTLGDIYSEVNGESVVIKSSEEQTPGTEYFIKGRVRDKHGNTLSFSTKFYGFNPRVPGILINEFTTTNSANHPEKIELFITADGNMAGVVYYAGCGCRNDQELIFPPVEVFRGEYIVIHTRPQGIPEEINETGAKDESGGLGATPHARDFWVRGGRGLSTNNGAITIFSSPGGNLLNAVIYSNRTSSSDERYRGFGSTNMLHRAECIAEMGGWLFEGEQIRPEDCIDPTLATATRSMNRNSNSDNTNTKHDWHIVPTSGHTFGRVNSDRVHNP
ncbi:MAG: hypothetical protein FWC36_02535 [Spirochaetes bacterium]|nr:hypothetical protein [Spirochaetota bacterium]